MKLLRTVLCYPDMDRIIVEKEKDLVKYDLSKVSSFDMTIEMTPEEFQRFRSNGQVPDAKRDS